MVWRILVMSCDSTYTCNFWCRRQERTEAFKSDQPYVWLRAPSHFRSFNFLWQKNGDNHRALLLGMLWGLLGQCMESTYQCWGKVTKEVLSKLQQLLVRADPISLWNYTFLSYQGLGLFVFLCSLDLQTKDAHCWSPAQGKLPNGSWSLRTQFPGCHQSPCLRTPNSSKVNCQHRCRTLAIPFPTSSSTQAQQYHAVEEMPSERFPSGLFLNKDARLLCNKHFSGWWGYSEKDGFLLATTKDGGCRGEANKILSLHPIQNSSTHL